MSSPVIPVSWGELLDKIAILEIKAESAACAGGSGECRPGTGAAARRRRRFRARGRAASNSALLAVNMRLWRIEDTIRAKEAAGDFGPGFIALARAVYRENDERGRIKQALNRLLRSALVEEKQYSAY